MPDQNDRAVCAFRNLLKLCQHQPDTFGAVHAESVAQVALDRVSDHQSRIVLYDGALDTLVCQRQALDRFIYNLNSASL
jgi:hypothetical protein